MSWSTLLAQTDKGVLQIAGDPVTYTPGVGSAVSVRGVFEAEYVRVDAGVAGVSSPGPAVFLRLSDLPSDPSVDADATVTVSAAVYTAHEVKPDGQGGVLMLLHLV